jgi:hypothetical protein
VSQRKYSLERTIVFVSEPHAAIKIREPAIARGYAKRHTFSRITSTTFVIVAVREEKTA